MSWQTYVDTNMLGSGSVCSAAILGLDGSTWATSPDFQVTQQEATTLMQGFKDANALRASGIHISGVKYLCIRTDEKFIYGKKGDEGCVIVKTVKAVLIGIYGKDAQPGNATTCVHKLADYLVEQGY